MNSYVLSAIILSALITFLLRAFPFLLFKEKELHKWKKNTFLSIILSTLVYMIFIRL